LPQLLKRCTYDRLLVTLLFLAITLACGLTPMQTDTWWQLRAGRDMWASGRVLLTDVYSHTSYGSFWLNHEWLAEVIYYAMYAVGGLAAVTLFATVLIVGGWIASWQLTKGPVRERFIWTALALPSASLWWEPRPHAFSLLFIPITVLLVARRRWWWLPAIFVVWANCHGGVLLGLVIAGVALTAFTVVERSRWKLAAQVFAACLLAATATPLGLSFWTEIPKSLLRISLYPLDEWRRPGLLDIRMLSFWTIAAAFAAALVVKRAKVRRASAAELTVYASAFVLLPMAASGIRHIGPFLMLAVPTLTLLLHAERVSPVRATRPALNFAVMASAALGVAGTIAWAYANEIPRLRWKPISDGALAALQQCPDNLYNRYDEGGYLLWFAPDRKVFIDGRQDPFSPELVLEHIKMETGGGGHEQVFARHRIRCAYLPRVSPTAASLSAAGWTTLYGDPQWLVLAD
jgi:hypothetical protein